MPPCCPRRWADGGVRRGSTQVVDLPRELSGDARSRTADLRICESDSGERSRRRWNRGKRRIVAVLRASRTSTGLSALDRLRFPTATKTASSSASTSARATPSAVDGGDDRPMGRSSRPWPPRTDFCEDRNAAMAVRRRGDRSMTWQLRRMPTGVLRELSSSAIRLRNVTCPYCGVAATAEGGFDDEHVIGRRSVPKGTLDGGWNRAVAESHEHMKCRWRSGPASR